LAAQTGQWLNDGRLALEHGQMREAVVSYERALLDLRTRGASIEQVLPVELSLVTAYLEAGEFHLAETLLQQARRQTTDIPAGRLLADFHSAWGSLHLLEGNLSAAESEFRKAQGILDAVGESCALQADLRHNLAAIEMRTGRFADAYRDAEFALHVWESTDGPLSDRYIRGLGSLGTLQFLSGKSESARASLQRAVGLAEQLYGPTHPLTAGLLESYAVVLDKLKQKKEAKIARRRAAAARTNQPESHAAESMIDVREALALRGVNLETK
jgi:tetratricopeptide (TPR) repeat protein